MLAGGDFSPTIARWGEDGPNCYTTLMADPIAEQDGGRYSRPAYLGIVLWVAGGLILRFWRIGSQSLWYDEGYTAWISSLSPTRILYLLRSDVGAPMYYLLVHYWRAAVGDSQWALRSLSALCSGLALLVFIDLARRVLRRPWAVMAAAGLFALSAMQVQYAQEARYYGVLSLLSVIALDCIAISAGRRRPAALAGLAICLTASLYTHNIMLLYWVGINGAWVLWPGRPLKQRIGEILLVNGVAAVLYAPWIPSLLAQIHWAQGRFWLPVPTSMDGWHTLAALLGQKPYLLSGVTGNWSLGTADSLSLMAAGLLGLALAGGFWRTWHQGARLWAALVMAGLLPVVIGFVQSHLSQPIFVDRIFIASCGPLVLLVSLPLSQTGRPVFTKCFAVLSALLITGAVLSAVLFLARYEKENWREAYAILSHGRAEPRLIVFVGNEGQLPFDYYRKQDGNRLSADITGLPDGFFDTEPPQTVRRVNDELDLARLKEAMNSGRYRQIDLVRSHDWFADPRDLAIAALHLHWRRIESLKLRDIRIDRYVPPEADPKAAD